MPDETFVVSLDFDGVLALGWQVKVRYAKDWFGLDLALDRTKRKGFEELVKHLGRTDVSYTLLMDRINRDHIMEYAVPDGCKAALASLYRQGFRFVVVTSREDHEFPPAQAYVKQHFGDIIQYMHNTKNEPKGSFMKRLHPRIHIDDDAKKLLDLYDFPVELVYYRQHENDHQDVSETRIVEMKSWKDFKEYCLILRRMHDAICAEYGLRNTYRDVEKIFAYIHTLRDDKMSDLLRRHN
jgi:hypothetical protein